MFSADVGAEIHFTRKVKSDYDYKIYNYIQDAYLTDANRSNVLITIKPSMQDTCNFQHHLKNGDLRAECVMSIQILMEASTKKYSKCK